MRKTYTSEYKAKIVLEVLREEQTLAQIAAKYEKPTVWAVRTFLDLQKRCCKIKSGAVLVAVVKRK